MSISNADIAFVKDLFAGVGTLTTRKIFGGLAIYADGVIFALIDSTGALMIKTKGALAEELAAEGSQQFIHEVKGATRAAMLYWTLPCAAMDEPELACDWLNPLCCKILDKSLLRGRISDAPKNYRRKLENEWNAGQPV